MIGHPFRALLFTLLAVSVAPGVTAQGYLAHGYSDLDGLPSPEVYDVDQAIDGRIWVTTRAGVAAFDGVEWEAFSSDAGPDLDDAEYLAAAPDGSVFVLSTRPSEGGARYRAGRWTSFQFPREQIGRLSDMVVAGSTLVVSTLRAGLWCLDLDEIERGAWTSLRVAEGLPSDCVHGLDAVGDTVIAATARGLVQVRGGTVERTITGPARSPEILGVADDPFRESDYRWLHGRDWIGFVRGDEFVELDVQLPDVPFLFDPGRVRIEPDGFGSVYFSYGPVLLHFDLETRAFEDLGAQQGILGDGANALVLDHERNLWIANPRGVTRLPPRRFANYDRRHGLLGDEVAAVFESAPGEIVFGHPQGLSFLNLETGAVDELVLTARIGSNVLEIDRDDEGDLWVALNYNGLARIRDRKVIERHPTEGQLSVLSVQHDRAGRLWIGSQRGLYQGVDSLDDEPVVKVPVRRVVAHPAGGVVALTADHGLHLVQEGGGVREITTGVDADEANNVFAIHFGDPTLVGTRAGLFRVEGERLVRQLEPFHIDAAVYFITADLEGRTWFGTKRGLFRWDGTALRHYTVYDGLAGQEANRAAGLVDSTGRLWVGTSTGVSLYRPRYDLGSVPPVNVRLLSIEVDGESLPVDETVRFGYLSDLVFGFRAVSFQGAGGPQYRCRLEGFDEDWLGPERLSNQQVRYTNLPAGSYRLTVQARHATGGWSEVVTSPDITVSAPFWQRGWFIGLVAGASGLAVFLVTSLSRAKRQSAQLERLVEERSAELMAVEARYREVFTRNRAAQVVVEAHTGEVLDINPAAQELLGAAPGVRGQRLSDVMRVDRAELDAALVGSSGDSRLVVSSDESKCDYELSACSYVLRGASVVHVILFDVTEQRRLQEQLQQDTKLKAIGQLAGGIAHDFNNLLTLILGYSDIVLERETDAETHQEVERIREAGERGAGLVAQLLAFSRRQVLQFDVLDLNAVLDDTVDMLQRLLGEAHPVRLRAGTEELCVRADRNQIDRVLVNLAVNARDALPTGGEVCIEVGTGRPPGVEFERLDFVSVSVSDQGVGMSEEVRERVLEPFFTTKAVGEGTGLGLPTVYGIVRQSKGELVVESVPGAGTTVTVFLPRVAERPEVQVPVAELTAAESESHTILFVEDDPALRRMCSRFLKLAGHSVIEAHDGEDALEIASRLDRPADLLLTDVVMPRMGGRELAQALRARWPSLRVLYVSGYSEEDLAAERDERCGFLQKPFALTDLSAVVRSLLTVAPVSG